MLPCGGVVISGLDNVAVCIRWEVSSISILSRSPFLCLLGLFHSSYRIEDGAIHYMVDLRRSLGHFESSRSQYGTTCMSASAKASTYDGCKIVQQTRQSRTINKVVHAVINHMHGNPSGPD